MNNEKKFKVIWCFILFAIIFATYFTSLKGDFVWDDVILIESNPTIKSWKNLPNVIKADLFEKSIDNKRLGYFRPVITLSYMIDYSIWKKNPFGFHLTNILFHSFSTILIFLLLTLITNNFIGATASILFATHPMHTEAVTWISGRTDVFACAFGFFSFILFLKYIKNEKITTILLSYFLFFLALFSKEMAVVFPVTIILYLFIFKNFKDFKKYLYFTVPYFILILLFLSIRLPVISGFSTNPYLNKFSIPIRFLTFLKATYYYFYLLLVPTKFCALRQFELVKNIKDSGVWIGIFMWLLLIFLLVFKRTRKSPGTFFYGFFLISLLPISNIIFLISGSEDMGFVTAERFLYIPSFGFVGLIAFILHKIFVGQNFTTIGKYLVIFVLFLINIFYIYKTILRNEDWLVEEYFYKKTIECDPKSAHFKNNLGAVYLEQGDYNKAEIMIREALIINPYLPAAHRNLAKILMKLGEYELAREELKKALKLLPQFPSALLDMGWIELERNDLDKAEKYFRQAIELERNFPEAWNNLGVVYFRRGLLEPAGAFFAKAITIDPEMAVAWSNLSSLWAKMGKMKKAYYALKRAAQIDKSYLEKLKEFEKTNKIILEIKDKNLVDKYERW